MIKWLGDCARLHDGKKRSAGQYRDECSYTKKKLNQNDNGGVRTGCKIKIATVEMSRRRKSQMHVRSFLSSFSYPSSPDATLEALVDNMRRNPETKNKRKARQRESALQNAGK